MIKVAIVEDRDDDIRCVKSHLGRFGRERSVAFSLDVFRNGNELMFDYQPVYDILLMDIEMPGMDGMTAAEQVRRMDKDVMIIFITSMAQYAIKGYRVRARSYILKPLSYHAFAFELDDAVEELAKRVDDAVLLPTEDGLRKVNVSEIYFVESQAHILHVHTKEGVFVMRESMKNMEQKLQGYFFERCHVSFLVNLSQVSSMEQEAVVVGDERVPVSRQKRKAFMLALTSYLGGGAA